MADVTLSERLKDLPKVNVTLDELKETKVTDLPSPGGDTTLLWNMREEACASASSVFKLQPQQRFLRRVLSPDAPTQGLLMVHGTGTGKTCTAIQIAEEYILRPEFQNKKVFVLANPAVQENFKYQIFDASQVNVDDGGITLSKQCTGRRYLEILQRTKAYPLVWSSQEGRERIMKSASKIIDEFYEFWGYEEFGNELDRQQLKRNTRDMEEWIRTTFDNRLIIIDEAHNLRDTTETTASEKIVNAALKKIIQVANGITLVLLTATPMFDNFNEIVDYFNLFLWNERRQAPSKSLTTDDFFTKDGDFVNQDARSAFGELCKSYVSYVKGENPFTFPFRLDPPDSMIASIPRTHDIDNKLITVPIKYLKLTHAIMSPYQSTIVRALRRTKLQEPRTICVLPENKNFNQAMNVDGDQYTYAGIPFLAPSQVGTYSAKFVSVLNCIKQESTGIVFVYSNIVEMGARLFAMCLEEHGFKPAFGIPLMKETSGEIASGSSGLYALFTSETSRADIKKTLGRLKQKGNKDGKEIRVIIASPKVSEGVDFKYVRQIHVLDPWYNMSRIEQVLGRGMRTCSHALLPQLQQNCTVYLHVTRHPNDTQETLDEYIYRVFVEKKAIGMAKVKKAIIESAMDCTLEYSVNKLPPEWLDLEIRQTRSQDGETISKKLRELTAPVFLEDTSFTCDEVKDTKDTKHVRPLTAILDIKDEILDNLAKLFLEKPVWRLSDITDAMKPYDTDIIRYILQNAVSQGFRLKDRNGRVGRLETKDGFLAFTVDENETLMDRLLPPLQPNKIPLDTNVPEEAEPRVEPEAPLIQQQPEVVAYAGISGIVEKGIQTTVTLKNPQTKRSEKQVIYTWPGETKNFSYFVREWYYVDHVMDPEDRKAHIFSSLNSGTAPPYLNAMVIDAPQKFYVFGPDEFYTPDKEPYVPIGAALDAYKEWRERLKDRFVVGKDNFFAAMKAEAVIFNVDDKYVDEQGFPKKADRTKVIGGRTCVFFEEKILNAFAKWFGYSLIGNERDKGNRPGGVEGGTLTKQERCMMLAMLSRKAIVDKKAGFDWYTREEWAVLSEDATRKDLLARLNPKKK
jgi:superfamily II DNA or RNA helicase